MGIYRPKLCPEQRSGMSEKIQRIFVTVLLTALLLFASVALFSPLTSTGRREPARIVVKKVIMSRAASAYEQVVGAKLLSPTTVQHHCPYYPPDVRDIAFIFSRATVDRFREVTKKYSKNRPIALLVVNEAGLPILANWLCVSAQHISVDSVLVVIPPENGTNFEDTLLRKGITAIPTSFHQECLKRLNGKVNFKPLQAALLVRVLSIMLLTDWGYDVAVFDPDAFALQEPFEMYQQVAQKFGADIVGQQAVYPPDLAHSIGFTLCMGAVFYRGGSPHLKSLWQQMSQLHFSPEYTRKAYQYDDQHLTNTALQKLGLNSWDRHDPLYNSSIGIAGEVTAVALGVDYSARIKLSQALDISQVRILHPRLSRHNKMAKVQSQRLWKLPVLEDYTDALAVDTIQTLSAWLEQICLSEHHI